jgi:N-acetylglutamate synthase-like GNAT family acetyltransferase
LAASSPVVRSATAADQDRVMQLVGKLGSVFELDPAKYQESFEFAISDTDRTLVHVAESDGDVVGYALTTISPLLYSNGPSAQLQEIVVDDEARVSGVGTALVRAVEAECEARGVTQLTVASRRAGGFYDRLGYTQQAEYMRRLF